MQGTQLWQLDRKASWKRMETLLWKIKMWRYDSFSGVFSLYYEVVMTGSIHLRSTFWSFQCHIRDRFLFSRNNALCQEITDSTIYFVISTEVVIAQLPWREWKHFVRNCNFFTILLSNKTFLEKSLKMVVLHTSV